MALTSDQLRPVIDLASTSDGFLRVWTAEQRAMYFEQLRAWYCEHCGSVVRDKALLCSCLAVDEQLRRERIATLIDKLQQELGIS
jgi:hypothetical protein